tara:strand:+ start:426 stop:1601 length:1176 start_codon:yes stop_codon:yes gene_type:complete
MPEFSQQHRSPYNSEFYIQDLGTAEFYGLEFTDTFEDRIIPNQNLVSRPSVLIEGSKILLDYSDIQNSIDKNFIDTLFTSMNSSGGTFSSGFTLSGAIYNDPVRQYSADLSASCTLNSYSDFKILGTFSSIGSTIETNFYHSNLFETIPQISSSVGLTSGITTSTLINYPTSTDTSFVSNQFQTGDYIDFNTASNVGRFTISGITVDSLSREIVTFIQQITPEDLKGTKTIISHIRKRSNTTSGVYDIESENAVIHTVGSRLVDGISMITIDSEIEKSLVLVRGMQYVFAVNGYENTSFQFLNSDRVSPYNEAGIYSIVDNTMNKQYIFFTPNNATPNQLYYNSSRASTSGVGGIQVMGNYVYSYNTSFSGSGVTFNAGSQNILSTSNYYG